MASFYWYDLETFGLDSKRDRIAQFAGQRTDLDMQPVGDPEVHYVRLSGDYLPDPQACLITGIGPTDVDQKGLRETESLGRIESLFSEGRVYPIRFLSGFERSLCSRVAKWEFPLGSAGCGTPGVCS